MGNWGRFGASCLDSIELDRMYKEYGSVEFLSEEDKLFIAANLGFASDDLLRELVSHCRKLSGSEKTSADDEIVESINTHLDILHHSVVGIFLKELLEGP